MISLTTPVLVLVILGLASQVAGLVNTQIVQPNLLIAYSSGYTHAPFEQFGFDEGGTITIRGVKLHNSTGVAVIFICTNEEYQQRVRSDGWGVCSPEVSPDPDYFRASLDSSQWHFTVTKRALYNFLLVSCENSRISGFSGIGNGQVEMSYTLYSREQQQITLGEIPLPLAYEIFTAVWVILVIYQCIVMYRRKEHRTPLHWVLLIALCAKLFVMLVQLLFWKLYELEGCRVSWLNGSRNLLFSITEIMVFAVLYLLSKGWRITRTGIAVTDFRNTAIALLILIATLVFFSLFNSEYYWLSLIITYFFMLPKIFGSITLQIRQLATQLPLLEHLRLDDINSVTETLQTKRTFFIRSRLTMVIYVMFVLIINLVIRLLLPWDYEWWGPILNESNAFFLAGVITLLMTPRAKVFVSSPQDVYIFFYLQEQLDLASNPRNDEDVELPPPWDLSKTFVVEWPVPSPTHSPATVSTTTPVPSTARPLVSLAYDAKYVKQQRKRAKKAKAQT